MPQGGPARQKMKWVMRPMKVMMRRRSVPALRRLFKANTVILKKAVWILRSYPVWSYLVLTDVFFIITWNFVLPSTFLLLIVICDAVLSSLTTDGGIQLWLTSHSLVQKWSFFVLILFFDVILNIHLKMQVSGECLFIFYLSRCACNNVTRGIWQIENAHSIRSLYGCTVTLLCRIRFHKLQ